MKQMDLNRNVLQSNATDGTANGICHLCEATICHVGPCPGFIAPWVYKYITHGLQDVLKELPPVLSPGSLYCDIYRELSIRR